MKKTLLFLLIILIAINAHAQQYILKKRTINDFAAVCWYNYRFGNAMFITTMNTYLGYPQSKVALIMENLDTDSKDREEVFKLFYRIANNYESLFNYLYGLNLEAGEAKEITNYIMIKYGPPAIEETQPVKIVWKAKSNKFFEGTKTFCDSANYWKYIFTIKGSNVTLELYPGINNVKYEEKSMRVSVNKLFINGDKIVDITNTQSAFKYENGKLYELNNEETWNEYDETIN
jgi:hypothetical protein